MDDARKTFELLAARLRQLNVPETFVLAIGTIGSVWLAAKLIRALASYLFPSALPGEPNTVLLASPRPSTGVSASAKDLDSVTKYDYIVVGTGTAGCVLAARLSEDPNVSVLAIESGHSDLKQLFSRMPAGFGQLFHSAADHDLATAVEPGCKSRNLYWPRGKMIGGCSSINAMIYNRGCPSDYDEWERLGNAGWSFKDVLPYMNKAEGFNANPRDARDVLPAADLAEHNLSGPWKTGYSHVSEATRAWAKSFVSLGLPWVRDFNTKAGMVGAGVLQTFIDPYGQRSSTAVAYLTPEVVRRPNLKIASGQTVTRVLFDTTGTKPRAVGVEMAGSRGSPVKFLAKATREVIVSAGAVHTPQVLKLSGIGAAKELAAHGVSLIKDLPGVGANLADHLCSGWCIKIKKDSSIQRITDPVKSLPDLIEWFRNGTGPFASNIADGAAFLRTADREDAPESLRKNDLSSGPEGVDLEFLCGATAFIKHGEVKVPYDDYFFMGPIMLRPESRGTITLASADPHTPPVIHANYLSTKHDIDMMVYAMKMMRDIVKSPPFSDFFRSWFVFGPYPKDVDGADDETLAELVRHATETIYHPMCSAAMGPASDPDAVVDAELKVHGVDGLRVVDASVFPKPVACHPCAPVVMTAEKAADMIKASRG